MTSLFQKLFTVSVLMLSSLLLVSCGEGEPASKQSDAMDKPEAAMMDKAGTMDIKMDDMGNMDGKADDMMGDSHSDEMSAHNDDLSYAFGVLMIRESGLARVLSSIDKESMLKGIRDELEGNPGMSQDQIQGLIQEFVAGQQQEQEVETMSQLELLKQAQAKNIAEGEAFLAEMSVKPGVQSFPSGTLLDVYEDANGDSPSSSSFVTVHYTGTFINGEKFDSSRDRGEPSEFPLNGVIQGFAEGIGAMKIGQSAKLYIPFSAAYGGLSGDDELDKVGVAEGRYNFMEPGKTLVFDVELISFREDK